MEITPRNNLKKPKCHKLRTTDTGGFAMKLMIHYIAIYYCFVPRLTYVLTLFDAHMYSKSYLCDLLSSVCSTQTEHSTAMNNVI